MSAGVGKRRVAVVVPDKVVMLDAAIPIDVFGSDPNYDLVVCPTSRSAPIPWLSGETITLDVLADADTIVMPGYAGFDRTPPDPLTDALGQAHSGGARLVSICTGAFALAAAGLLANRPATTHWRAAALLQTRYPDIDVQPDRLFVDDGDVLTSAGVTSGIDLCLHIIRKDFGAAVANERARDLVAPPVREGGQAQYTRQFLPTATSSTLEETRAWMLGKLDHPHTLDELARRSHLSRRTFIRRFRDETGTSTRAWLTAARIDRARELLETTDLPVDRIGYRVGLGSPANTRAVFNRHVGISPGKYRRLFKG
ncbi:helix-turn-helix domain-containing protein [Nocardia amamiensis]|uniref:Helix-turn-helix domain-containing protein n=1 Tax=Nocardia amamiensis TaxID=404578 RepID=A0ABS0CPE8_9NOCA|nr:helix-turn-helix domain-containing protein [Nocardia amamiensis]MBF6298136.1 helix-turn-helix domain-containing protein [Nocardia amamiensis]